MQNTAFVTIRDSTAAATSSGTGILNANFTFNGIDVPNQSFSH